MPDFRVVSFGALERTALQVDAQCKGGTAGNAGDDPIGKLIGTGNQGRFRYAGSVNEGVKLCILYASLVEPDWPDSLDLETGRFIFNQQSY